MSAGKIIGFLVWGEVTGLRDLESELLETQGEIDIGDDDVRVQLETTRCEVENPVDAVLDESIGNLLSRVGWHRDDAQPDTAVPESPFQFGDRLDGPLVQNQTPG